MTLPTAHSRLAALVLSVVLFAPARAEETPRADGPAPTKTAVAASNTTFADALADLRQARTEASVVGTRVERAIGVTDTFFTRVSLESLGTRELAEVVRWRGFDYSKASADRARIAAQRLEAPAAAAGIDGALALTLRVLLSSPAGIKGPDRVNLVNATLSHPAYVELLQSDYGDLALDAACRIGLRDETHRATILGLAGKLDAAKATAAADGVANYWGKIEQAIPEGESRQAARQQLVDYLAAVLAKDEPSLAPERRTKIKTVFDRLDSPSARGVKLLGNPAPELHFDWASEGGWKSLADLRGKVVVLDFWATWCGACIESFPHVAQLTERYRGADVVVVGVTSLQGSVFNLTSKSIDCRGDAEKEIRLTTDFIKAKAMTWPVVFSREPAMNPAYGIRGIPTTFVIAPDGTVQHMAEGFVEAPLVAKIDALLAEFKLRAPPAPAK